MKILQPESPPKVPKKSYAAPTNEADEVRDCDVYHHLFSTLMSHTPTLTPTYKHSKWPNLKKIFEIYFVNSGKMVYPII